MKKTLLIVMVILFYSCKNSEDSNKVTDIANGDFEIVCIEKENGSEVPEAKMYFNSTKIRDKVFITTTPACRDLSDNFLDYNMPEEAIFKISGYYGGGGYYYYGLVKDNQLKVYRAFIEETIPSDDSGTDPSTADYEVYMTVTIYEDGSTKIDRLAEDV